MPSLSIVDEPVVPIFRLWLSVIEMIGVVEKALVDFVDVRADRELPSHVLVADHLVSEVETSVSYQEYVDMLQVHKERQV